MTRDNYYNGALANLGSPQPLSSNRYALAGGNPVNKVAVLNESGRVLRLRLTHSRDVSRNEVGEGASARRKELFDEEPGGDVQPLSVHVGRDREDLCRCRETELVREESHVVLVVARAVREHLHREQ